MLLVILLLRGKRLVPPMPAPAMMYNVCRAISRVRDTVILIHGARSCAQTLSLFTKFFDGFKMQGKAMDHPMRVECSKLDENDIMFGGADRVRRTILDAERRYHPSFIPKQQLSWWN